MKKTISTLVAVLLTAVCLAQVPQKFNYQAIARSSTGEFIKEQVVRIQFSLLDGGASGTEVYKEEHTVNTDANGLISAQVGGGTVLTGVFSEIDWSKGSFWLQTNLDAGSGFELLGAQELLSVPYAIQATYASSFKDEFGNSYKMVVDPQNNSNLSIQSTSVPNKVKVLSHRFPRRTLFFKIAPNPSIDGVSGITELDLSDGTKLTGSSAYNPSTDEIHVDVYHFIDQNPRYYWPSSYAAKNAIVRFTAGNEAGLALVSDDYSFTFPATTVANTPTNVVVDQNKKVTWSSANSNVEKAEIYKYDETSMTFKKYKEEDAGVATRTTVVYDAGKYRLYELDGVYASPFVEFTVP